MRITTKSMFTRRWKEGLFGNMPIMWPTVATAIESGYGGRVGVRYQGASGGGPFLSGLLISDLPQTMRQLTAQGYAESDFYTYEDTPPDAIRINGEVREYGGELCLLYSTVPKRMRESLKEGQKWATGVAARDILRELLEPEDHDHLFVLLDAYPEHTIEFTGYRVRVGVLARRMIVWEVRYY